MSVTCGDQSKAYDRLRDFSAEKQLGHLLFQKEPIAKESDLLQCSYHFKLVSKYNQFLIFLAIDSVVHVDYKITSTHNE